MIKYQLVCQNEHEFEGWFQSSDAFMAQSESGLVSCPVCETNDVRRALMAPNLASLKTRKAGDIPGPRDADIGPNNGPNNGPSANLGNKRPPMAPMVPESQQASKHPTVARSLPPEAAEKMQDLISEMRSLQAKIKSECKDVGRNFAEEARKIHYGEVEPAGIIGEVTKDEREQLDDEGIDVMEMPWLPQDN